MTIIDRAERALLAHRDALQEIQRGGHSADPHVILDSLTTINHWGDRDQRADLTSEILDALELGELDHTALRSLSSTLEYLAPDGQTVVTVDYDTSEVTCWWAGPGDEDEQRDHAEEAYNAQLMREE